MTLSRQRVVGLSSLLTITAAVAGCASAPDETRPLLTFGPESLQVAFLRAPDTLGLAGDFAVTVVARNRTPGLVPLVAPCGASGFVVRVSGASGYARELPRASCGAAPAPGTLSPGDSLVATVADADLSASGVFRLEATYATSAGRSGTVERALVVRNARTCPAGDDGIKPALNVAVQDLVTRASLPALVVATDGGYRAVLMPSPGVPGSAGPGSYFGAAERSGTYTITVSATGYEPWTRENVVVTRGADCHVQQANLLALLERPS